MPPAAQPAPAQAAADRLLALADRCVQCGLCLPACPTYALEQVEAESPRGRIALARAWTLGTIPPTERADVHLDHCLGCRSCEAVCPAGVQYGELLVETRTRQRARRPAAWKQKAVEWLVESQRLLSLALRMYGCVFTLLPKSVRALPRPPAKTSISAPVSNPNSTSLFIGCIARTYEAPLREAVARLCMAAGTAVQVPDAQSCCGAVHAHAGNERGSEQLATHNRKAFAGSSTVLTLSSGCHEAVARALSGVAATEDTIAFLHRHAERLRFREHREHVALHLPCTQRRLVKSVDATRALLSRVPGLKVVELPAGYGCCGAAGTQMLLDPARAETYRRPLVERFDASGATRLLSANIGCRLHFANAIAAPVQHPLEFLADCLA
jgi:glycolate oxidase iron-sulfur subunit